ncbi:phosphotransferase [Vulcaniibacterium tengchongense]|uniref:Phosphotransferase family enzyme n=1 Tax=Vulcaniibacterium tengchongense TaxID=1273429 RepID=A0A3N4V0M7_9GAMM|nr:phosphotransferase [Vulcaniibacterium tengchongense]RPE74705.1 phosphotransferase family enzyme [Vulcaniibacterium tengchongense]
MDTTLPSGEREHPRPTRLLKRGERLLEPDVYLTHLRGRPAVIKDYGRYRRTPLSPFARLLVRREARVLRRLRGWRHAPALLGTFGLALGIEFVPGVPLGEAALETGSAVFQQLRGAVAALHAAGITHNDLHPANVLVCGTTPVLIDFASALRTPRWLRRLPPVRELRRSDMANVLKMQQRLTGEPPSPREAALLARPRWVRSVRSFWQRHYRRLKA